MEDLFKRVSIRKFEPREVEDAKIREILRASMQAPSAGNQQPWEFYVVKNKEMLQSLAKASPYAGPVANAPVAIVTAYRENCLMPEYAQIDLSICMENMWIETDALELGGVWLGIAPLEDRMKYVEKTVGIPEGQRAFGIFALGYPAQTKTQQNRFDESRIHVVM